MFQVQHEEEEEDVPSTAQKREEEHHLKMEKETASLRVQYEKGEEDVLRTV